MRLSIVHTGRPVAWGRRRRDWQIGSRHDQREVRQLERLATATRIEPIVFDLDFGRQGFELLPDRVSA